MLAIAFGLFAVAHLLTLLGLSGTLEAALIVIRVFGHLSAIFAAFRLGAQS